MLSTANLQHGIRIFEHVVERGPTMAPTRMATIVDNARGVLATDWPAMHAALGADVAMLRETGGIGDAVTHARQALDELRVVERGGHPTWPRPAGGAADERMLNRAAQQRGFGAMPERLREHLEMLRTSPDDSFATLIERRDAAAARGYASMPDRFRELLEQHRTSPADTFDELVARWDARRLAR